MHMATIKLLERRIGDLDREITEREDNINELNNDLREARGIHSLRVTEKAALEKDLADAMAMTVRDGAQERVMGGPMAELLAAHGKVDESVESVERKSHG